MLNPDKNLFSVAPVGQIVIIGRQAALKGGMTRDNAMNLLTWLILSCNATPEEIGARIKDASTPTIKPVPGVSGPIVSRFAATAQPAQPAQPVKPATLPQPTPQSQVSELNKFIGDVDAEEQAALDDLKAACETAVKQNPLEPSQIQPPGKPGIVDESALVSAWGVS
jgi:hypothetical protein